MSIRNAPRSLALLLATVVLARLAIAFVVHSPLSTALAWSALLAALSLAALCGKHLAATGLAYLCIILGADTLLQLLSVEVPVVHRVAALLWASLVIGVGVFILRSKAIQRFYGLKGG
jgi:hypothetical protein